MIIGSSVTQGYQHEISAKFYDCWGHIHLTTFIPDPGNILSDEKVEKDDQLIGRLKQMRSVESVKTYCIQSAILKANDEMEGVVLKGMDSAEEMGAITHYIKQELKTEAWKNGSDKILISSTLAEKLNVHVGGKLLIYIVDKNDFRPRARRVYVKGIYSTGLEDFDKLFVICDARLIHSINHESISSIQGYEINVKNEKNMVSVLKEVKQYAPSPLHAYCIQERFPGVFSWLHMMQTNEGIIIMIMMIIAFINMITALLILILERTAMVGVLKALGMPNTQISKVFILSGSYIVLLGTFMGAITAIVLCKIQDKFHLLTLDEASYFIRYIPVYFNWMHIGGILITTIVFCILVMFVPSLLVRKITPVKALRFQ